MEHSYEEFVTLIGEEVEKVIGSSFEVRIEKVLKNNSCEYYGMIIKKHSEDDSEETSVSPAIYLYSWYEKYMAGKTIEELAGEIIETYKECEMRGHAICVEDINRESAVDSLFYRLVSRSKNEELLKESPHMDFLDLALTFHFLCSADSSGIQSFRITNKLMKDWMLDLPGIFDIANANMHKLFPEKIRNIGDVIAELSGYTSFLEEEFHMPIYVLTNERGINGAAALLYSTKLQELAAELQRDIYILPSSIHEVLLVPDDGDVDEDSMKVMVREVNAAQVLPEEQLSDSVYFYSWESGKISVC